MISSPARQKTGCENKVRCFDFVCSVMSFIFTFALYIDLYKIYTRYTGITYIPIYLDIAGACDNKVCAG